MRYNHKIPQACRTLDTQPQALLLLMLWMVELLLLLLLLLLPLLLRICCCAARTKQCLTNTGDRWGLGMADLFLGGVLPHHASPVLTAYIEP